jgi:hypothetical protein
MVHWHRSTMTESEKAIDLADRLRRVRTGQSDAVRWTVLLSVRQSVCDSPVLGCYLFGEWKGTAAWHRLHADSRSAEAPGVGISRGSLRYSTSTRAQRPREETQRTRGNHARTLYDTGVHISREIRTGPHTERT